MRERHEIVHMQIHGFHAQLSTHLRPNVGGKITTALSRVSKLVCLRLHRP